MKKILKIIVCTVLTLTCILGATVNAFAADKPRIYADSVKAEAGATLDIPVYIENNSGIMGTKITITYADGIEILDVKRGDAFSEGNFIQNTALNKQNSFDVVWNNDSANSSNGVIFTVTVKVADDAKGDYSIDITYDPDNTFDEDYDDVELDCSNTIISINSELSFFQKIANFFVMLWNKIVALFT